MDKSIADVMIHFNASLPAETLAALEEEVRHEQGVISACMSHDDPHLMLVAYLPESGSSRQILQRVTRQGLTAQLIGL